MKRTVKLCEGCVWELKNHFPYLSPDGTPMKREDLIIEVVEKTEDCDNYPDNFNREPIWEEV